MCMCLLFQVFAHQTLFTQYLLGLNTPLFREGVEAQMMSQCQIGIDVMLLSDKQHLLFLDSS